MTDFEICKRIAEIEGHLVIQSSNGGKDFIFVPHVKVNYNPLTDKALCFDLVVKYKLSLIAPEGEQKDWDCVIRDVLTVHKSPSRAICLAIIEAHKE
jgi:hypothetical protein